MLRPKSAGGEYVVLADPLDGSSNIDVAVSVGTIFGICVYLVMNFVVLPLSAVPFKLSYPPATLFQGFVSHAILVGIPIALAVRWADRRDERRVAGVALSGSSEQ